MIKKVAFTVLGTIMILSLVLSGCGGTTSQQAADTQQATSVASTQAASDSQTASGPQNQMPIVSDGSVTLTVSCPDNNYAAASLAQNLPVWQEVEKVTGVKIKWDAAPDTQYATVLQTKLAAGVNLPDIIFSMQDVSKYGKDGIVIPLDELMKKYGYYQSQVYTQKPILDALAKTPEGVTYQLLASTDEEIAAGPSGWMIRKDWLDKLGLQEPVTTDDWYNVLKAFKEKDPNGNGQADEIPLTNYTGVKGLYNWGNAWGLHLKNSDGFYPDSNGKVQYEWLDPRAKEMVTYLNKLVKDGLYDIEFATVNRDQHTSKIIRNIAGSTIAWLEACPGWNSKLEEGGFKGANWVYSMPPAGPNGFKGLIETSGNASDPVSISKDCKNPDAAFKWLDYVLYSDENALRSTLGIEGKSYTKTADGKVQTTDFVNKNPDGLGPVEAVRSLGAWVVTCDLKTDYVAQLKLINPDLVDRATRTRPYIVPKFEVAMPTDEEFDNMNRKYNEITTYRDEMVTKFILGQESMDKWDTFTKTITDMGINDVVAIKQAEYDRATKK